MSFSPTPTTLALLALPLLLVAHLLNVRHQRHKLRRSIEALFLHRYALSAEDEARGLPRMTQAGLRGIRDAQVRPLPSSLSALR